VGAENRGLLLSAEKGKINTSDKADEETFFALITVCENTN